jgi:cell division protein FtsN
MNNRQMHFYRQQCGGTLLGLIIGLIVGLAIAVVVALVITKGATPFTNKTGKQEKLLEPTPGQIADPNKPLYGNKDAAKEAAKDFVKDPNIIKPDAQSTENKVDQQVPKKAQAKQEHIVGEKPAVDKTGKSDKADIKVGEPKDLSKDVPTKAEAADEKSIYYLQAGAFRDQSEAENARAKLALLGVEARISDRTSDAGILYRVRIGPFSQVEAMNKVRNKLSESGMDVAVVRNQK